MSRPESCPPDLAAIVAVLTALLVSYYVYAHRDRDRLLEQCDAALADCHQALLGACGKGGTNDRVD